MTWLICLCFPTKNLMHRDKLWSVWFIWINILICLVLHHNLSFSINKKSPWLSAAKAICWPQVQHGSIIMLPLFATREWTDPKADTKFDCQILQIWIPWIGNKLVAIAWNKTHAWHKPTMGMIFGMHQINYSIYRWINYFSTMKTKQETTFLPAFSSMENTCILDTNHIARLSAMVQAMAWHSPGYTTGVNVNLLIMKSCDIHCREIL